MMRKEMKWMEESKRSGTALTTRKHMRVQCGTNANLSLVGLEPMQCGQPQGKTVKGRWQLTTRTRKTHYKNKEAQLWFNPLRPRVIGCTRESPHASGHSTCCWACRSVCPDINSPVVNASNLFTFWPVREFLVEIHTAKKYLWGVVFTHSVGCSRPTSSVNDLNAAK